MDLTIEKRVKRIMELMERRAEIDREVARVFDDTVNMEEPIGVIMPTRDKKSSKQKANGGG